MEECSRGNELRLHFCYSDEEGEEYMAYNKAKEEYKWKLWKAKEEEILYELGIDQETIQKLREYDWDDFKAERRFCEHQSVILDCMESFMEKAETETSISVSVTEECSWLVAAEIRMVNHRLIKQIT